MPSLEPCVSGGDRRRFVHPDVKNPGSDDCPAGGLQQAVRDLERRPAAVGKPQGAVSELIQLRGRVCRFRWIPEAKLSAPNADWPQSPDDLVGLDLEVGGPG